MMKYRMIAIDLDGTLFDSTGQPPQANIDAVHRAQKAGVLVVPCTGRGLKESSPAVEALKHTGPAVFAGGSLVYDVAAGRNLHRTTIDPELALQVVEHLDRNTDHAVLVLLDSEVTGYDYLVISGHQLNDNTRWWFRNIGARLRYVEKAELDDLQHALRTGIVAVPEEMGAVEQALAEIFGQNLFVQHFMAVGGGVHVLEVFAQGVNKWAGLTWLAEQHGIAPEQIAAIGDDVNDIAMIEAAGCGIAMGNAIAPVCQIARRQTLTNDEAGVAAAIDKMMNGEW